MIELAHIELPDFGGPETLPAIPLDEYRRRLEAATKCMAERSLDVLVVYADREHSANINYLTGFDPRFEEALLLLDRAGRRLLVVGNECMGYLPDAALQIPVELFQEFSLPGQPRDKSRPLKTVLSEFGIGAGVAVGCVGWKMFGPTNAGDPARAVDVPCFIVDALRELVGQGGLAGFVVNATGIFMDADTGLRLINDVDQIARFEYAAIHTSCSVYAAAGNIWAGTSEKEIELYYDGGGLTQSCHPMVGFGEKARRGLASASDNLARTGDTFTLAFGIEGSLTCRAGIVGHGPQDLPPALAQFYPRFCANYFDVVTAWYEAVKVGAVAGEVFDRAERRRDGGLYTFAVNTGHYIHLDEWTNSPFAAGSKVVLRSGMAIQMDIIPVSAGPFCYSNAEDGIVLADESLRRQIAELYPEVWKRIAARQQFMRKGLGIRIDDSVLPLSNTPGWLAPYCLSPGLAMVKK